MSRRIDIELTSSLGDGTWTWRAAGAKKPKGVLDGSILPTGAKVGDELKVEAEQEIDGITILQVVQGREKQERSLLELLPVEREFQPVVETRASRDRGDRPRRDGDRPRRDGDRPRRDGDRPRRDGGREGGRGDKPRGEGARDGARGDGRDRRRDAGRSERRGPSFTPPPELPQRPKPKRLRPGKHHRNAVLADLPPEQRPIAELAVQGMGAVRQRVREENAKAEAEGRPVMPEASVLKLAEDLLPKLRVAEWRDRAEAAKSQSDELDLRDLRSVVAASDDPIVARDETTRSLAEELKQLLVHKQEQELSMWFGDIDAALAVGRVIRALRLSSQPPKAGVPFPTDIAQRLADSTNASLSPLDAPDRWAATLEAAAFSPVRSLVKPARKPDVVNDELTATLTRLAPALPHVAELFGIEVDPKAPMPKPLRPAPRPGKAKDGAKPEPGDRTKRPDRGPKPRTDAPSRADAAAAGAPPATSESVPDRAPGAPDDSVAETPVTEATDTPATTVDETPAAETTDTAATTVDETPAAEPTDAAATTVDDTPADDAPDTAATTVDETPADDAPDTAATTVDDTPADDAPDTAATTVDETPADDAPDTAATTVDETPAAETTAATTVNDTPADDAPPAGDETPAAASDDTIEATAVPTDDAGADDSDQTS